MVSAGRPAPSSDASALAGPWRFAMAGSGALHGAALLGLVAAAALPRPEPAATAGHLIIELVAADPAPVALKPADSTAPTLEQPTAPVEPQPAANLTVDEPVVAATAPAAGLEAPTLIEAPTVIEPSAAPSAATTARASSTPHRRIPRPSPSQAIATRASTSGGDGAGATNIAARPGPGAAPVADEGPPPVVTEAAYREPPAPPVYPRRDRELRVTGTTVLRALVDREGRTREVRVWRSSGSASLDDAAASAARRWAFAPARRDGRAIEAWVEIPVRFELR